MVQSELNQVFEIACGLSCYGWRHELGRAAKRKISISLRINIFADDLKTRLVFEICLLLGMKCSRWVTHIPYLYMEGVLSSLEQRLCCYFSSLVGKRPMRRIVKWIIRAQLHRSRQRTPSQVFHRVRWDPGGPSDRPWNNCVQILTERSCRTHLKHVATTSEWSRK